MPTWSSRSRSTRFQRLTVETCEYRGAGARSRARRRSETLAALIGRLRTFPSTRSATGPT